MSISSRKSTVKFLTMTLALCSAFFLAGCNIFDDDDDDDPVPVAPSGLSYLSPTTVFEGVAMTALVPTVSGTVESYSVAPALPAGISLDTTTGVISGTPTAVSALATYTVTAENSTLGNTSFDLDLEVIPVPVPDVDMAQGTSNVDETGGAHTVEVVLSESTINDLVISYTVAGTATDGTDFTIAASPLTIPAGSTSGTIAITVLDDTLAEGNESIEITLTGATNGNLGAGTTHVVTIVDDEGNPTVNFDLASSSVAETAGATSIGLSLLPAAGADVTVTIQIAVAGTTASPAVDFSFTSLDVVIPAGATTGSLDLTIIDDADFEGDETVALEIAGAATADIGTSATHTLTINDDDPAPTAEIAPTTATLAETDGPLNLTVSLNALSSIDTVIPFTTGGTADAADYSLTASPLTIPAGQMTGTITITPVADGVAEGNETATITLQASASVVIGPNSTSTITLEDPPSPPAGLTYSDEDAFLPIGQPITPLTPSLAAGSADNWTITPTLPTGLSIDPTTGVISGSTDNAQGPIDYTITASSALGSTTATITIRVGLVFLMSGGNPQVSFGTPAFSVAVTITETASGIGAPGFSEVSGWSLGIEIDPTVATILGAVNGADAATANGGNPPGFATTNILPNGVTTGVVVDLLGVNTLTCDTPKEILLVNCETTAGFISANPGGASVEFPFVGTLGTPTVESIVVVSGASVTPEFEHCVVDFTP